MGAGLQESGVGVKGVDGEKGGGEFTKKGDNTHMSLKRKYTCLFFLVLFLL